MTSAPARTRLPNRRPLVTEILIVGGRAIEASVGFDPATGRPRELFLTGATDGADLAAIQKALERAAVESTDDGAPRVRLRGRS